MNALCSREESAVAGINIFETIRAFANGIVECCLFRVVPDGKVQGIKRFRPLPEIDRQLYDKYSLSAPERHFIESMIKPMGEK